MTIALDYGTTSIKAIIVDGQAAKSRFFSFSLGFKSPILSRVALRDCLKVLESISRERIFDENGKVLPKVYAGVGLPVYEAADFLTAPVLLTGEALASLELPIIDVGSQFVHFTDRVSIASVNPSEVINWIPFKVETSDVDNFIANKSIYGSILPAVPRDLYFEQALSRVRIREMFRAQRLDSDQTEIYLTGAVFSKAPYLEQAVLMILDGLQSKKILKIWLDRSQVLPAAGLLKHYDVAEFSHLGDELNQLFLGTALSFENSVEVEINLGFKDEVQQISLTKGDLYVFPLRLGETALVKISSAGKRKAEEFEVTGGAVGLVFDLRGRPLLIPESVSLRHTLLTKWERSIGATGQIGKLE